MGIFMRLLLQGGSTRAMKAGFNVARLLPAQFFARYQFAENFTQSPERHFTISRAGRCMPARSM
jgi:hypothetical protein